MTSRGITIHLDGTFETWRSAARTLAVARTPPADIQWIDPWTASSSLFAETESPLPANECAPLQVSPAFVQLARSVICHSNPQRWPLLYRLLYRITTGERHLLEVSVDDDVHTALMFEKSVRRDAHKAKAFVRFRELSTQTGTQWVAYHKPDHHILPLVAPFFRDRFHHQHWTIVTPSASVAWDGKSLRYAPGIPASTHASPDDMEDFWRTYYASTFNPARVRLRAMAREMPRKFWQNLPEAEIIDDLVRHSNSRVDTMIADNTPPISAADFLPTDPRPFSLPQLSAAATHCRGCDLCDRATQTIFGEGNPHATLMLVGEQPGDTEDLAGRPFIGPAGQLLNTALLQAGLNRESLYVTNAVKHFHWEPDSRGKRRIHRRPTYTHISQCRPWLLEEITALRPHMIVCLGSTAAQSLLGPHYKLTPNLGRVITDSPHAPWMLATLHPAALLRIPDPTLRERHSSQFIDLTLAAHALQQLENPMAATQPAS